MTHIVGDVRAGTDRLLAYTAGGYWTRFWGNGAYWDTLAQYTWYHVEAQPTELAPIKVDTGGWALSSEIARPYHLGSLWVLEPQGQLSYQTFDGGSTSDIAALVHFENADSLIGRVGLRLARTFIQYTGSQPLQTTVWLRFNVSHQFLDPPKTSFSSDDGPVVFQTNLGNYWGQVNLGLTTQMSRFASLYANLGYDQDFQQASHAWSGKIGMRFNW